MLFRQLYDAETSTYTYLLADEETREAVIIDSVRDQVERDVQLLKELNLKLLYALETHIHADHVTGSGVLRNRVGCKTVTSKYGGAVCSDLHVDDGDVVRFGKHAIEVRATPGHTDGCLTFVVAHEKMAFTGDALLVRGTGRTDFQQGDARKLYNSIKDKIFSLGDDTVLYPGHDYKGRMSTTVAEERAFNPRIHDGVSEAEFVETMANLRLAKPKKIDEAVPANLHCGITDADETVSGEVKPERAWAPIVRSPMGIPEVTVQWVAQHGTEARLIDVREPHEYTGDLGHVAGTELVPLDSVPGVAHLWNREQPIVVVCRSGGRSGRAAQLLESMGFKRIASMAGGMMLWNQAGLPVSRQAAA